MLLRFERLQTHHVKFGVFCLLRCVSFLVGTFSYKLVLRKQDEETICMQRHALVNETVQAPYVRLKQVVAGHFTWGERLCPLSMTSF